MAAKQALKDQHAASKATKKERADWCASLHTRCMSIFPLRGCPGNGSHVIQGTA